MQKLSPGDIFHNRFRIVKELGVGGMGVVYHAVQTDVSRDVALKLLRLDKFNTEISQQRFLREFKILSKLSQENIMAFYALAITPEGIPYAVCEYIDGRNLSEIMNAEGTLSWRRTLKLAIQIARGLEFAHGLGVVHRDLKPSNIMVLQKDDSENVKLIDFGLARIIESGVEQKLTGTGLVIGTLHYMSPEQITNQALDGRSDIYSLACVLFECMSGEKLFEAENALSIAHLHTQADPKERLSVLKKTAPMEFVSLIEKMLAKSPAARPTSMSELIKSFEFLLQKLDGVATDKWQSLSNSKARNSKWYIIAFSVIVLVFAVAWSQRGSAPTPMLNSVMNNDKTTEITPRSGKSVVHRAQHYLAKEPAVAERGLTAWLTTYGTQNPRLVDKVEVLRTLAIAEDRLGKLSAAEGHINEAAVLSKKIDLDSRDNRHTVITTLEMQAEILSEAWKNSESKNAVNSELQLFLNGSPTPADVDDVDLCLRTLSKHGEFKLVANSA
ncbi:MAG: serine/threonine protein kinase, partial [Candidatus Obscuribacterales bacterium]|nr:serine/threonine protein kinase [Candidatus Obscuribacterales bacterium]